MDQKGIQSKKLLRLCRSGVFYIACQVDSTQGNKTYLTLEIFSPFFYLLRKGLEAAYQIWQSKTYAYPFFIEVFNLRWQIEPQMLIQMSCCHFDCLAFVQGSYDKSGLYSIDSDQYVKPRGDSMHFLLQ